MPLRVAIGQRCGGGALRELAEARRGRASLTRGRKACVECADSIGALKAAAGPPHSKFSRGFQPESQLSRPDNSPSWVPSSGFFTGLIVYTPAILAGETWGGDFLAGTAVPAGKEPGSFLLN
jgi:hypothetical protein